MLDKIKKIDEEIDYTKAVSVDTNGKISNFNIFRRLGDLSKSTYYADISLNYAKDRQNEMKFLLRDLYYYKPNNSNKKRYRIEVLKNAKIFFQGRELIIAAFEDNIFLLLKKKYLNMKNGQKKNKLIKSLT